MEISRFGNVLESCQLELAALQPSTRALPGDPWRSSFSDAVEVLPFEIASDAWSSRFFLLVNSEDWIGLDIVLSSKPQVSTCR